MTEHIVPSLVNGGAVMIGLYLFWSVGRMRERMGPNRIVPALIAGVVAAIVTFAARVIY